MSSEEEIKNDETTDSTAEKMKFYPIFTSNQENSETLATERDSQKSTFGASKFQSKYQLIKQKQMGHLHNEIFIMNTLNHPFVLKLNGVA